MLFPLLFICMICTIGIASNCLCRLLQYTCMWYRVIILNCVIYLPVYHTTIWWYTYTEEWLKCGLCTASKSVRRQILYTFLGLL